MRCILLSLGILLLTSSVVQARPFRLNVPKGWHDLSLGAPAENFLSAPEGLSEFARSGRFQFVIASPDFTVFAVVAPSSEALYVTAGALEELAERMEYDSHLRLSIKGKELVQIHGVGCVRLTGTLSASHLGSDVGKIIYLVPSEYVGASVEFTGSPSDLSRYGGSISAIMEASDGIAAPLLPQWGLSLMARALFGAPIGLVGVLLARRNRSRRSRAPVLG